MNMVIQQKEEEEKDQFNDNFMNWISQQKYKEMIKLQTLQDKIHKYIHVCVQHEQIILFKFIYSFGAHKFPKKTPYKS